MLLRVSLRYSGTPRLRVEGELTDQVIFARWLGKAAFFEWLSHLIIVVDVVVVMTIVMAIIIAVVAEADRVAAVVAIFGRLFSPSLRRSVSPSLFAGLPAEGPSDPASARPFWSSRPFQGRSPIPGSPGGGPYR